jgi:three-Cys-motif partner protein
MIPSLQKFGGRSWTQDKLERVRKYLVAYSHIMKDRPFKYAYIDGFAGTGYHELAHNNAESLFDDADAPEVEAFLDGSARIALQVEPRFHTYIFIEKSRRKVIELEKLRADFPDKASDIVIETADANAYLQRLCTTCSWTKHRAVLFIDPFGMQLSWETLTAVGNTKAIDTWILFPVSAVNRLLKNNGDIPPSWRKRLDIMFGGPEWFDVFFPVDKSAKLFETEEVTRQKTATMETIGEYFNKRLATVFAGVAPNPYTLRNSTGAPLFLLCFAAANPHAVKPALRIAQDILKRDPAPVLFPESD